MEVARYISAVSNESTDISSKSKVLSNSATDLKTLAEKLRGIVNRFSL